MDARIRQERRAISTNTWGKSSLGRLYFVVLSLFVIGYAFLAGFRSLTEYDLGWLLATGRWIAEHHRIPSTDVFSYTAHGNPWVYPVGSGLILYSAYLLGGYAALTWLGAVACSATTALLLRRGSVISAVLAIVGVPLIAIRTRPRADMFTVVLFAAFLTVLWQQHQTGRSRLWLLPVLMIFWVNLHLGFVAGLALIAGYVFLEALEVPWPERRQQALGRLRVSWPWLLAACGATLANPWGWGIFDALLRQESAMAAQLQSIPEWGSAAELDADREELVAAQSGRGVPLDAADSRRDCHTRAVATTIGGSGLVEWRCRACVPAHPVRGSVRKPGCGCSWLGADLGACRVARENQARKAKLDPVLGRPRDRHRVPCRGACRSAIDRSRYRPRLSCKYRSGHIRDRVILVVPGAGRCVCRARKPAGTDL